MEITSEQLARIEHCLPVQRGNVSISNLQIVNAILYVAEHGCKWRGLPRAFWQLALDLHAHEPLDKGWRHNNRKAKGRQPGLFDMAERREKLTQMGDPLVGLNQVVDWEAFRVDLSRVHEKERKSNAGAKALDVVLMFKMLVLQQLHNLSDDGIEYQVRDRLSFMRFLGLQMEDRVPDAKTVWSFRERLKSMELVEVLFKRFHEQLAGKGYVARGGQMMIDATLVEVPRQRNTREENAKIKAGETPERWKDTPAKLGQKDVEARWVKKNEEDHYGYKNHVNVDQADKLIRSYQITDAAIHESKIFEELMDYSVNSKGKRRAVYAGSAYRSEAKEAQLAADNIRSQICEKGQRGYPLTEVQKAANREKSRIRARIEHVFGAQAQMGGHWVRTIGKLRARVKIGMMNLVYNMMRLGQLLRRDKRITPAMA